jgi:hypothetical protein
MMHPIRTERLDDSLTSTLDLARMQFERPDPVAKGVRRKRYSALRKGTDQTTRSLANERSVAARGLEQTAGGEVSIGSPADRVQYPLNDRGFRVNSAATM